MHGQQNIKKSREPVTPWSDVISWLDPGTWDH